MGCLERGFANEESLFQETLGVRGFAFGAAEKPEIARRGRDAQMLWTIHLLLDDERPTIQSISLVELSLRVVECPKIVEAARDIWMFWSQDLLTDCQGPLEERLRLGVLALHVINAGQTSESVGHAEMLGSLGLLHDQKDPLEERSGLGVVALGVENGGETAQAFRQTAVLGPELLGFLDGRAQPSLRVGETRFLHGPGRRVHRIVPLDDVSRRRAEPECQNDNTGEHSCEPLGDGHRSGFKMEPPSSTGPGTTPAPATCR